MTRTQCLWYALDKWHAEGGYLMLGKSTHWAIPHVLHLSRSHMLTHFVPPADLKAPWHSMFGFNGNVIVGDPSDRCPMSKRGIFIGSLVLVLFGAAWSVHHSFKNILRLIP
jgi:hypothetical protein